ncbi:hypothetical protein J2T17_004951 [Paenibacillus mucilaginosus]|uniref:hypothetical protein n=1 Tax=Paenibacillus mucilaginosus TaxID=61624 RepID=UPI003D1F75EA
MKRNAPSNCTRYSWRRALAPRGIGQHPYRWSGCSAFSSSSLSGRRRPEFAGRPFRHLLWALLLCLGLTAGCGAADRTADSPGLLAALSFAKEHILLENGNDFVWTGVTVTLNGRYVYKADTVPRGTSALPFAEFRDGDGRPFDRSSMTPRSLVIEAGGGFNGQPGRYEW